MIREHNVYKIIWWENNHRVQTMCWSHKLPMCRLLDKISHLIYSPEDTWPFNQIETLDNPNLIPPPYKMM